MVQGLLLDWSLSPEWLFSILDVLTDIVEEVLRKLVPNLSTDTHFERVSQFLYYFRRFLIFWMEGARDRTGLDKNSHNHTENPLGHNTDEMHSVHTTPK